MTTRFNLCSCVPFKGWRVTVHLMNQTHVASCGDVVWQERAGVTKEPIDLAIALSTLRTSEPSLPFLVSGRKLLCSERKGFYSAPHCLVK